MLRSLAPLLASFLIACGSAPTPAPRVAQALPPPPDEEAIWQEALAELEAGEVDGALTRLRRTLEAWPALDGVRRHLATVLEWDGDPDAAAALLAEGVPLSEGGARYALLLQLGQIRFAQAERGPSVTERRGSMTYSPSPPEAEVQAYRRARYAEAAAALERAVALGEPGALAVQWLATTRGAQGDHEAALALWRRAVRETPQDGPTAFRAAEAHLAGGRVDDAETLARRATELEPHLAEPWRLLGEVFEARGLPAEAERARDRAAFEELLPSFAQVEPSDDNLTVVRALRGDDPGQVIAALAARADEDAGRLLAAFVWQHTHDANEAAAFAAIEARADAGALLLGLARAGRSTCTIRDASRALARRHHPEAFAILGGLLPRDVRFAQPMYIARSLATLGDPRAVPLLVQALERRVPVDDADPFGGVGRTFARGQAALALGSFDAPESRAALERALEDETVALEVHAALYRLTSDAAHLARLEGASREAPDRLAFLLDYLEAMARPELAPVVARVRRAEHEAAEP